MSGLLPRWFTAKPFAVQIVLLALVLDPIGFVSGYLLAPSFGVEPLIGGVYGLVAASVPMSWHVMSHAA
ncbi:hypothetical protein [Halogranum rubrum]|uniref:DUF8141 domain-containing protein n=1 Tax=Halogranum salarium B-1 TaxID=1210908 RepID=J3JD68_9EURY|nr:hypothetical protein [Halogranum salarium]EJN57226.1 hypothetical protein HSB1_46120 [Halogranum salarium B-1]